MQKWEYCWGRSGGRYTPIIVFYSTGGAKVIETKRDKSKGDKEDGDAYGRMIAEIGTDGWELVGVVSQPGVDDVMVRLYFKRPLP